MRSLRMRVLIGALLWTLGLLNAILHRLIDFQLFRHLERRGDLIVGASH